MEITGRLPKDAVVRKIEDGREVVRFSIVINDRYKTKGGEIKNITIFIDCSFWLSSKVINVYLLREVLSLSMGAMG